MTIGYVGNFRFDFTTESHLSATLEGLGHRVIRIQEDAYEGRGEDLYAMLKNVDMFFFTRTWGRTVTMDLLTRLKERNIPTVSYHLDLYIGLQRNGGLEYDPFWRTDYVFTPDGDARSQTEFEKRGINHIYIRPGVFEPECYLKKKVNGFGVECGSGPDIIFVGSYHYHPEWPYRQKLIDWLRNTYGSRFEKYGNPEQTVRGDALNMLYTRAKIVIGDSLVKDFDHEYYWSDRVYETLGRGGFLIHPRIKGLEEEFEDKKHLVLYDFNDFDQLKQLIDYYLEHTDEREQIRRAGHEHVKQNCSYTNRMKQMFEILKEKGIIK